jgi:SAM-dependent methyltransferase
VTLDQESHLAAHNLHQRTYFEGTLKKTMVPRPSPYVERQVRELIREARLSPGDRILDVGCGMGRYTLPLAGLGYRVEGLDLAPGLLARLGEYNGGRFDIPLHAGDLLKMPAELGPSFDAVIGFFTLHHLHDIDRCCAALAGLLKPGGRLAFLEPNPYFPAYYLQILLTPRMTWKGERGLLKMRRGPIFAALRRAGFVNAKLGRFGLFPPLLANRRWGRLIEAAGEALISWSPFLAFQLFSAELPAGSGPVR